MTKQKRGRKPIEKTEETITLQNEVSVLIGKLINSGIKQQDLAESLQLFQPEISQLYRKKRILTKTRFEQLKSELISLVKKEINPNEIESISSDVDSGNDFGTYLYDQITVLKITPLDLANEASLSYQTINLLLSGKTSVPQFKTKQKIIDALKRIAVNKKKSIEESPNEDESVDSKLKVGIPFNSEEIEQSPSLIGVYAIHDKRGHPSYIGKGNIKTRLKDHITRTVFASEEVAYSFSYFIIQKSSSDKDKSDANEEALLLEKILTKFAGNTILLNKQNREDLSERNNATIG